MSLAPAERWTLRAAAAMALSLVGCLVLLALDARLLDNGDPVWLKPARFSLAFGVHLLTLVGLARLARAPGEPLHPVLAAGLWLQIAAAAVEWGCIALQAGRGVHSHFNYATFFDHAVFTVMGWGTAVLLAGMVLCAWGTAQSRLPPPARGLLLCAQGLAIGGALVGVLMVMPTAEQRALLDQGQRLAWIGGTTVGVPSGRTLPFFHWDLVSGDWRVVHFVGLHGLQALALLAWLSGRAPPSRRTRLWALVGAWSYAALLALVLVATVRGHSVFTAAGWSLAVPGLLFALSAAALLRAGGRLISAASRRWGDPA